MFEIFRRNKQPKKIEKAVQVLKHRKFHRKGESFSQTEYLVRLLIDGKYRNYYIPLVLGYDIIDSINHYIEVCDK